MSNEPDEETRKEKYVSVNKKELEEIHNKAEDLWIDLQKFERYELSSMAKEIVDTIESGKFYKEE